MFKILCQELSRVWKFLQFFAKLYPFLMYSSTELEKRDTNTTDISVWFFIWKSSLLELAKINKLSHNIKNCHNSRNPVWELFREIDFSLCLLICSVRRWFTWNSELIFQFYIRRYLFDKSIYFWLPIFLLKKNVYSNQSINLSKLSLLADVFPWFLTAFFRSTYTLIGSSSFH